MLNGCGLRVVLWVAGCEHHCKGCHNPETWDVEGGIPFDEDAKNELFEALDKDYIKGLTLSGGDPMHPCNREDIYNLCAEVKIRFPEKDIWLYTGYTMDNLLKCFEKIITTKVVIPGSADMENQIVLVEGKRELKIVDYIIDGEFIESLKDNKLRWRGSSNQKIWHNTLGKVEDVTEKFDKDMQEDDYSENYLSGEKCGCGC